MLRSRGTKSPALHAPRRSAAGRGVTATLIAWLLALPVIVSGAEPWHDDLDRAREASRVSHRTVLALFVATWQPGGGVAEMVIGTPDARALVTSCFEPVIIDVDRHADLTRRLGIKHVPTVALLGEHDEVLASFACPSTTPEFVVAAAQAVQEASMRRDRLADQSRRSGPGLTAKPPASKAAISMVTSKVRELSDFASHETPVGTAPATASAAAFQQPTPVATQATVAAQAGPQPAHAAIEPAQAEEPLPAQTIPFTRKPPAWPAETPFAPLATVIANPNAERPALEPRPAGMPVAAPQGSAPTPWLATATPSTAPNAPAVASPAPPTDAESSASVSDMPADARGLKAPVAAKKPSPASQFFAALQKPFAGFSRKPATEPAVIPPSLAPPTLAPTRPQWPSLAVAPPASDRSADAGGSPGAWQQGSRSQAVSPLAAGGAHQVAVQASSPADSPASVPESMPLGLEGYCPVTLAAKGAWTEGRAQYGVRHRGRTYLFAGAVEQQTFLADPDRDAPALSGDDPVVAMDEGRSLPGQRRYGIKCGSRMYLFSSAETRAAFQAQPERYTGRIAQAEQPAAVGTRTY
ncbi:MAG: hypothetical protein ACK6CT_00025 [Planctomycetia bacterium]